MESKMALNYKCKSQKRSAVEKSMNTFLIIYLGILLFEAVLSTILKYAWQAENKWDEPFYNQKTDQERNSSQNREEELFLKAVSLCHTVQISYDQTDGPGDPFSHANGFTPQMEYYASSPDEKALVEATKRMGVTFIGSRGENMEIKTFGKSEKYKLLHVLEFDADRRRMSVILQKPSGMCL
ncbi:putative phospholipid-transporting ATPase IF [Labeo rohita]|uniref:Putative phospholipid-transporting ATPase IF n=1 Tax=Labeo rohita TaxID=84645 RepID=A0A498P230_LABRO|nr:putative phospholipid-transporting ATPase IF [Labeo rohita]